MEVFTVEEMIEAYQLDFPKMVIGKGSNSLFSDRGFEGLVILNRIDFCQWEEEGVLVGSGYSFSRLGSQSARKGFKGLEFASGIPATVGGAIFMNAGANGSETCRVLKSVDVLDGYEKKTFLKEEIEFGYRTSSFQTMNLVILSAFFHLERDASSRKRQLEILFHRMKTQPLQEKSAGCIFQNPPGYSAGALIEQCGLKGIRVGGAKVSEKHANFIVNESGASAKEVKELIELVQERVFEQTGVFLTTEVRIFDE